MREELIQVGIVGFVCAICSGYVFIMNTSGTANPVRASPTDGGHSVMRKNVWLLYHAGFGNLETDQTWGSWRIKKDSWMEAWHEPPTDIAIVHQPALGIYSSHNETVLNEHLKAIGATGIGTLVVPWDGVSHNNGTQSFTDVSLKLLFKLAPKYNIDVIPLLVDFAGRNETTIQQDVDYFRIQYSSAPGQHKIAGKPVIVIYDAHKITGSAEIVLRNPDVKFVAAALSYDDFLGAFEDGYAGFVSYFATDEQSWCANSQNWKNLVTMASDRGMFFVPTVAPGHNNSVVSRWNTRFWRDRKCDESYTTLWNTAITSGAQVVMINSWNDWQEGSVIEPVVETEARQLHDKIWCGKDPKHFIKKTTEIIAKFKE